MNVSAYSIRHPIPAILLFILLTIAGLFGFRAMKVQDSPDLDFPVVFVRSALPGASPPQLESDVARKIENSLASISQVRHIYTTISDGMVETSVQFRLEKDVAEAMADVRDAVGRVRSDLPADLRDPVITRLDLADQPVLTYTVSSANRDEAALSWLIDSKFSKALLLVPGVGRVARVGGVTREILVELDPARLASFNVSAADISRQLQRVQQEASGGMASISGVQQSVRTIGTVRSVEEIAALSMALPDGRKIRLDQVARVLDTHAERRAITLLDGKPVIGFTITRNRGASEIEVAKAVRSAVAELAASEPHVTLREAFNGVDTVRDNYAGSMSLLYEGALLTVVVVWFFLRDWRATLVSALALPLSVIPTFMVMHWLGFSLNLITLLALALVVGILVDDAIVEIENIMRHLRMGKTPLQAALDAADEIGLAVVATTATLIAVFLPTAFMGGVVGQYFRQFGWTASVAVGASLIVARMVTPMMAAYLLKPAPHAGREHPLMARYLAAVAWCLRNRSRTLAMAAAFFVASLALIPFLSTAFFPPVNGTQTQVTLELAPGSTLEETRQAAEHARALLVRDKDVVQVYSAIGGADVQRATLTVSLKPRQERGRKQIDINRDLRAQLAELPGVRTTVGSADEAAEELTVSLEGDDAEALKAAAQAIQREIRTIPGLGSIYSDVSVLRPEVIVRPDPAKAADLGVSAAAIGDTLRVATSGDYDQDLSKLNLPERQVPIRVRLPESARQDLDLLQRLTVPGKSGNVPLSSVADVRIDSGVARIDRRDRIGRVVIHVELNGADLNEVEEKVDELASLKQLPPGVKRSQGDREMQKELFSNFGMAMLTGIICVYMVLVLLFRGFMQPVTVMSALPLSIGGAFAALLVTRSSLSLPSLLGLLMLMGIAVKNSILLVDYAMRARRLHGKDRVTALVEACHKRVQPIVMTSVAMAAGMLPVALGWGADPSLRSPMAIAVIGGLITSTVLSLLVVPVVFTYVDDWVLKARAKWQRRPAPAAPHHADGAIAREPAETI
ncbi:efflux RND transporter permease subunit [Pseudoduganella ginsengisoli]|uniref:AcrB/AcrD/AcrF family protein n=1 Tax=Pseudoduganella ginsengisoli TaxID=1462440 RepID=A0A6L6Q7J0_9BURK|nr:efflux RND transporter permease subunit [Pseudoduganella ginsengisoli]MTW05188.1 AcrB/AcrD/AcrF family protein [Pseudoduganella ginsengisoli]